MPQFTGECIFAVPFADKVLSGKEEPIVKLFGRLANILTRLLSMGLGRSARSPDYRVVVDLVIAR